jgi:replicative DNA helicase
MSVTARSDQTQSDAVTFLEIWFKNIRHGELIEVRPLQKRPGGRAERQRWFPDAKSATPYIEHCVSKNNDVYVGALPRARQGGTEQDVGSRKWVWGDLDYGTVGHAKPAAFATRQEALATIRRVSELLGADPTFLIDTGGGFHVWLALKEEPPLDVWRDITRRLAHALGADMNALDLPRILRVPGTKNFKTDSPRLVKLVDYRPSFIPIERLLQLPSAPAEERSSTQKTRRAEGLDTPFGRANDIPIDEVMAWLGVAMHREGNRIYCACPVHGGSNASQMVVGGGDFNTAHCYGDCQKSYSPVDVVAAVRNIDPKAAVEAMAEQFGFDGFRAKVYNFKTKQTEPEQEEEPWDEPIPLEHSVVPKWPQGVLDGPLARFSDELSVSTQTPTDMCSVLTIGAISAAVGGKFVVRVKDDYDEPVHVFVSCAMPPSTKKSPVFRIVFAPIYEAERVAMEAYEAKPKEEDDDTVAPRFFVSDATPEAVEEHLAKQGGRLAVLSSEGSDLFEMMAGRYSPAPNITVYLKGYSSDLHRTSRIKRGECHIPRPCLTVCNTTQPSALRTLASKPELRGRGLTARFLYSVPRSNIGHRDVRSPAMSNGTKDDYHRLISELLAIPMPADGQPYALRFTDGAMDLYWNFADKIEKRLGENGDLAETVEWGGKITGATVRVAALLHLADRPEEWERPIEHDTLLRSITLTEEYWIPHARIAFDLLAETDSVEAAKRLLVWIRRKRPTEFSPRDAHRGLRGKGEREKVVDPALQVLVDHGYIRAVEFEAATEGRGRGRPRGARYLVNPKL